MTERTMRPAEPNGIVYPTDAEIDAVIHAMVLGCCGDDLWRGLFCRYHDGFEDGMNVMLDMIERAQTGRTDG